MIVIAVAPYLVGYEQAKRDSQGRPDFHLEVKNTYIASSVVGLLGGVTCCLIAPFMSGRTLMRKAIGSIFGIALFLTLTFLASRILVYVLKI